MTQAANLAALGTNAGTTGILPIAGGGTATASGITAYKNRIINANMAIAQRGTSSISVDNGNWYYPVDRFSAYQSMTSSKFTIQQNAGSVTPPTGFNYYIGATVTSAYSVSGSDWAVIRQTVEGYNWADLCFGTSNAKTFTASFWVRSSLTGIMGGAFYNNDGSRSYPYTYTINAANTWEYKTITVAGDTSGTWNSTNNGGITIEWSMGTGSTLSGTAGAWASAFYASATGATNILATNGATLYIAGVQIEVGSQATNFDVRPYGTELSLCQRYCEVLKMQPSGAETLICNAFVYSSPTILADYAFKTEKRAQPSLTTVGSLSALQALNIGAWTGTSSVSLQGNLTVARLNMNLSSFSGFTTGNCTEIRVESGITLIFNSEL